MNNKNFSELNTLELTQIDGGLLGSATISGFLGAVMTGAVEHGVIGGIAGTVILPPIGNIVGLIGGGLLGGIAGGASYLVGSLWA